MRGLSVQVRRGGGPAATTKLRAGETRTFGVCSCQRCSFDLRLPLRPCGTLVAGRVAAHHDHWRVGNQGRVRLIVENLEHPDEYFGVAPGRPVVPVPFETARVVGAHMREAELTVLGPANAGAAPARATDEGAVIRLDERTAYYAVLRALCEPRLRHGPESPLPSSNQVASALRTSGYRLTARAVDAHIDYLLDKLDARPATDPMSGRGWKREVLVARALRLGLVEQPQAQLFSDSQ